LGLVLKSYTLAWAKERRLARVRKHYWKEGELCQEQKDRPGELSVKEDVLRVGLNAKRAAKDEDLRVRYVALGEGLREASAALHAKQPAVFDARGAG